MILADVADRLRHRLAEPDFSVRLPPEADTVPILQPSYFQLRLAEMRLSDARRWGKEIVPATFVLTEFNHGPELARRPFFVSNGMLSHLPQGVDVNKLRVNFRDTLVLGPTPAKGGDVSLFVSLFEMPIDNRLKTAFSILEKLFQVVPGPVGSYLRLADQLATEISTCLGDTNLKCILADRSILGMGLPPAGYHAYIRANGNPFDRTSLTIKDGTLTQRVAGQVVAVPDRDYCLVKVEHLQLRDDYESLPFHGAFEGARKSLVFGERGKGHLQMLECISMIYGSPDLSEDDKARLIAFYQAKLLAVQTTRGGVISSPPSPVLQMQARVLSSAGLDGRKLADALEVIKELHGDFTRLGHSVDTPITNDDVTDFLRNTTPTKWARADAETLVKAVAAGTIAG